MVSATGEAIGQPGTFDLCGGHPVLDFVNSLDNRFNSSRGAVEGLRSYESLLRFTGEAGLLDPAQIAQVARTAVTGEAVRALRAARTLRETLAAIFYAMVAGQPPPTAELAALERYFLTADRHRELRWRHNAGEQSGLVWSWRQEEKGDAELPVWALALAARDLLLSPGVGRVRACEAETCRWLFLDNSKSHTRRWCKMKVCGNRVKARRYQARHAD